MQVTLHLLYNLSDVTLVVRKMSRGKSGRVVVDIEPSLKARLYSELAKRELTMKEWFIENAEQLLSEGEGQPLFWEHSKDKS